MRQSTSPTISRWGQARWDAVVGFVLALMVITLVVPFVANRVIFPNRKVHGRTRFLNNLKQVTLALHSFNDVYRRLPPAFDKFAAIKHPESAHVHLLPFLEQDSLHKQYVNAENEGPENLVVSPFLDLLDNSSTRQEGVQNYAANLRVFTDKGCASQYDQPLPELARVEPGSAMLPRTFSDGTSNTIVLSTRLAVCGHGGSRYAAAPDSPFAAFFGETVATAQGSEGDLKGTFLLAPRAAACVPTPLLAHSTGTAGITVGLGDGSARFLSPLVSAETWNRAMQPNDGGSLGSDW